MEEDVYHNYAELYFDNNRLVVGFGENRSAVLELTSDKERELVEVVLSDVNFWHNFLSSLSAALTQQLGVESE